MAATNRSVAGLPDAESTAAALREAAFVHLLGRADGAALAATGILASACASGGIPFHASVVRTRADFDEATRVADDGVVLPIGMNDDGLTYSREEPVCVTASTAATALGAEPDPVLALAGVVAEGGDPTEAPGLLADAPVDQAPGVAIPTADVADGIAHSTLVHTDFSGNPDAAAEATRALAGDNNRAAASLVALAAVDHPDATSRAAVAIARAVHPYFGGPFETLEGYADVLGALAQSAPGIGLALMLGDTAHDAALSAWRSHAATVHAAVQAADLVPRNGLVVADVTGPVEPTARLLRDYRAAESIVLAIGDGEIGAATVEQPLDPAFTDAAATANGTAHTNGDRGYARVADTDTFIDAFTEAL